MALCRAVSVPCHCSDLLSCLLVIQVGIPPPWKAIIEKAPEAIYVGNVPVFDKPLRIYFDNGSYPCPHTFSFYGMGLVCGLILLPGNMAGHTGKTYPHKGK
jgi:hypothetical protein